MKKFGVSLILIVFIFSVFYPAIYATENIITNELSQTNEVQENENLSVEEDIEEEQKQQEEVVEMSNNEENNEEIVEENVVITNEEENLISNEIIENVVQNSTDIENIESNTNTVTNQTQTNTIVIEPEKELNLGTTYTGTMYIDTPIDNQICTLPESNKLKISGWAVSNDSKVSLKLYINDWLWAEFYERTERKDLNAIATNYGGTKTTPKAGFSKEIDISNFDVGTYTIRIDQVSRTGQVINSASKKINIRKKQYAGAMYIDTPTDNQICTLPETNKLKITGWAVSNDSQVSLKLYINDWLWAGIYERTERKDVNAISANYGGTKTTPKAGFSKELDISVLGAGTYTIRVDQVSRYGKVISSASKKIIVKQKQYAGAMYIDTPTDNQICTLPETNKLKITGWAVSNDSQVSLKLYINNWLWAGIYDRTERKDVNAIAANYGGAKTTPKAGFSKELDISVLEAGSYTIRIDQVSRDGRVISSASRKITVKQKEFAGTMCFDSPVANSIYHLPDTPTLNINGWAVSNDKNSYILVSIDGNLAKYSIERTKREDADALISPAYGGTVNTPKAGVSINVDISSLVEGKHTITVMQVSRYDKVLCSTQIPINISTPNYGGMMNVDSPVSNTRYHSGWLEVKGWALTDSKGDFVDVYLDGNYVARAERQQRPDVLGVFEGVYGLNASSTPGFYSQINTSNLAEGTHTLKVIHYSGYGKEIQSSEVKFLISNTQTWGIDVSHYQGSVDWNSVRNSGVNFAILKIGEYRESSGTILIDSNFETYYNECKRLGIAVGGYFYSYAFDPNEASHEASACLAIIGGRPFEMPIFLDVEDDIVRNAVDSGRTNVDNLTNGAITFCSIMNQHGYQSGVYANKTFFTRYLNASILENYNIWLAHYTNATDYSGRYDMWQYTSSGSIPGINGPVDLNWCFKRYY